MRWYLRYSLSLRDVEELLAERGLEADHTTIWRWVQRYGPTLEQRLRRYLKATNKSWRVDETYIRVKGRWCYLYRAIDSTGATIDFLLSALRDAAALLKPGLALLTQVRKHMKALPLTLTDKLLLNARNMAETIIGHLKAFPRLISPNTALR